VGYFERAKTDEERDELLGVAEQPHQSADQLLLPPAKTAHAW
jgi:hypothetical protein